MARFVGDGHSAVATQERLISGLVILPSNSIIVPNKHTLKVKMHICGTNVPRCPLENQIATLKHRWGILSIYPSNEGHRGQCSGSWNSFIPTSCSTSGREHHRCNKKSSLCVPFMLSASLVKTAVQHILQLISFFTGWGKKALVSNTSWQSQEAMPKKFRIRATGEKMSKTVFPASGRKRTSHSLRSITQVYSARKGQSKYLHAIAMYEEQCNRMLGGERRNANVIGSSRHNTGFVEDLSEFYKTVSSVCSPSIILLPHMVCLRISSIKPEGKRQGQEIPRNHGGLFQERRLPNSCSFS